MATKASLDKESCDLGDAAGEAPGGSLARLEALPEPGPVVLNAVNQRATLSAALIRMRWDDRSCQEC